MAEEETTEHPSGLPETEVSSVGGKCSPGLKTAELCLKLATECMKKAQSRTLSSEGSTSPKFHNEQCKYLSAKLKSAVESGSSFFDQFQTRWLEIENRLEIYKLLLALATEVESFILVCCKDAWIQAALTLPNVSPHISSIGFNLELCGIVFSDSKEWGETQIYTSSEVARISRSEVTDVKTKALLDEKTLLTNVQAELNSSRISTEERELANYVLFKFNIPTTVSRELSPWSIFIKLFIQFRGERKVKNLPLEGTTLVKGTWLGTEVAKKTFVGRDLIHQFKKEAEIHAKLSHPNIISLLCCDVDLHECSIVMEWMDGDLHNLIQQRLKVNSEPLPFNILEAVGIMRQIAEGVDYLHQNSIVHRDLKSMNILIKIVKAREIENIEYVHVRVADFGMSKTKGSSNTHSSQTPNRGTNRWMAPEVIQTTGASERRGYDARKCDVYSFAMVCLEILTGDLPFSNISSPSDVKKMVLNHERPDLPDHCRPEKLATLIKQCWDQDPKRRPQFSEICAELKYVQWLLMTGPPPKIALYLKFTTEFMEGVQKMTSPKFNKNQCEYLAGKLKLVVQSASSSLEYLSRAKCIESSSSKDMARQLGIFKLLLALANEIKRLIQCCCSELWIQAAMTLTNMSQHTSTIGFYLELCKVVFSNNKKCEAIQSLTLVEIDKISKAELKIIEEMAIEDEKTLLKTMEAKLTSSNSENKNLVSFSLQRLKRISPGLSSEMEKGYKDDKTKESSFYIIWGFFGEFFKNVQQTMCLRKGVSTVYKATWLGIEVAKKTIYTPNNPFFMEEVEILSRLCHPNITSVLCCAMDRRKCSIVMELMDGDLSTLQQRVKGNGEFPPFTILEVVGIIHQIAEGMNYLHQNGVVHGNLKPSNILIKSVKTKDMENGFVHVKVTDFGLVKTKQRNVTLDMGTTSRMVPKVNQVSFKSDVYNFARVCHDILINVFSTNTLPPDFSIIHTSQSKSSNLLSTAYHPKLPKQCPSKLESLIEKCWQQNSSKCPSFVEICEELKFMKYLLLAGLSSNEDPHHTIEIPVQASSTDYQYKSRLTKMEVQTLTSIKKLRNKKLPTSLIKDFQTVTRGIPPAPQSPRITKKSDLFGGHEDYQDLHTFKFDLMERNIAFQPKDDVFSTLQPKHKVFLSHSGVQKDLVEQLCFDLERSNRFPFFESQPTSFSIQRKTPVTMFQAIQQCEVGVVILSKEFFKSSKWPMLELVAMVKSFKERCGFKIIPVFLEMSWEECFSPKAIQQWVSYWSRWAQVETEINILEWQAALKVLGSINGIPYKDSKDKLRKEIVDTICELVCPEGSYLKTYMQGRVRLCKAILKKINLARHSEVCVVGFHGILGIGKTMVCKALCDDLSPEFHGRVCHLELGCRGQVELLQQALKRLTNIKHQLLEGWNEDECLDWLKKNLHKQKVFLAIDNVSSTLETIEQVKIYLSAKFAKGSVVIVVAGSLDQLQMLNIQNRYCFEMPELEMDEARSLFLYHAAPKNENEVDLDLITRCVQQCSFKKGDGRSHYYLPLALKMLGVELGYESTKWAIQLDEMNTSKELHGREHPSFFILRKIFNALSFEDQLLVMDVVLFCPERFVWMKGWNIFEWLGMVYGLSMNVINMRLDNLKRKLLFEYMDDDEGIRMHDLWREFCVMETNFGEWRGGCWINEAHSPLFKPAGSRLSGASGKLLQRICLRGSGFRSNVEEVNLGSCSNVTVLKLVNWHMDQVLDLRDMRCLKSLEIVSSDFPLSRGSPLEVIGLGLLNNLVILKWDNIPRQSPSIEEIGFLTDLQVLQLESGCSKNKLPNLGNLISLKRAKLCFGDGTDTIVGLGSKMVNLRYLDLGGCYQLRSCPGVGDLFALEQLVLRGCTKLKGLPNLGRLFNVRILDICGCHLISDLPGLGDLFSLQELRAEGCSGLDDLPDMRKLTNLQVLNILFVEVEKMSGLGSLIALQQLRINALGLEDPSELRKLTRLETVVVNGHWGPQVLPSPYSLVNLKHLTLLQCTGMDELPSSLNMRRLQAFIIRHCSFKDVSGLSNLATLQSLEIQDCGELQRLPHMHKLTRLESLDIMDCPSLTDWEGASIPRLLESVQILSQLETLRFRDSSIIELPNLSNFPRLIELDLVHCEHLMILTNTEPLKELAVLRLYGCRNLGELPDFSGSKRLISFTLYNCGVHLIAEQIEELKAICPALVLDGQNMEPEESMKF